MKKAGRTLAWVAVAVFAAGAAWAQEADTFPEPDISALPPGLYAVLNTSRGYILAELFEKEVPITTLNFVALANGKRDWIDPKTHKAVTRPLYHEITFHRVISQFMIQTGDPTGVGDHDCGFLLPDEIKPDLKFDRPGRLAMANLQRPNSGSCQFFITETEQPSLDGKFTIFGQVLDGMDVVKQISRVVVDSHDKPRANIMLHDVLIVRKTAPVARPAAK